MEMRRMLALAALLVACAWGAAAETVLQQEGGLGEDDSTLADGRYVDWYKVQLTAGVRYFLSAESDEIDIAVILRFGDGGQLTNNDFHGSDAGLVYTAVRSETVEVGVVNALDPENGSYAVSVAKVTPARAVQAGQKISRTISEDSENDRGWRSDSLMLIGGKGDRGIIRVRSSDFDPMLRVQSRTGFADESDDGGSSTDVNLSYLFLQQGQLEVVVRATDPADGGRFDLEIERQAQARTLQAGASIESRMRTGTDLYVLEGKRGQAVYVAVESDDFDPLVQVTDRLGRRGFNDDHGEGTTARLHHVFADNEPVSLAVLRTSDGEPGAYRLSVEPSDFDADEFAVNDLAELADGDVVRGHLSAVDLQRQNRYVHRYTFTAEANQVVRLELSSESFDAYLEVIGPNGFLMNDDDSLGGYNALLETVCRDEGTYTVRVTTASDWETGFYELAFSNKGGAEPLFEEEGMLEHRDERDISGRYFDTYTFEVEEDKSVNIEMMSGEIDSYLYVWDPNGDEIYSDDDGGGESNARVSVQNAAAGTWTVYATSNDRGQTGAYTLRVLAY